MRVLFQGKIMDSHKILHAMMFAKKAHSKQKRKYTNEPYIVHPFAVAGLVTSTTTDTDIIIAAYLHDVVEDTGCDNGDIEAHFGVDVANLVYWVTKKSKRSDGNRKMRVAIDLDHLSKAPPEAKTIKLADIIDNLKNVAVLDPEFASIYMNEKAEALKVLGEGDKDLYYIAQTLILNFCKQGKWKLKNVAPYLLKH